MTLSLDIQTANAAAGIERAREDRELATLHSLGDIGDLHAEAEIRLVGAVALHCLSPGHALNRKLHLDAEHFLENRVQKLFIDREYIVRVHKGELHIDLRELRLTVRAEILVAVAARQLEVAVIAGAHEELL